MSEPVTIGNAMLYLGDCREVMPTLAGVDAVVTDPPYGLGAAMSGGTWGAAKKYEEMRRWDDSPASQSIIDHLLSLGVPTIIWGGNFFCLPWSRCWLSWSKENAVPTMAAIELAWTNFDKPAREKRLPVGVHTSGHPTQKPLALMSWCIGMIPAGTVLDPFMGSGTTGVACARLGRPFLGVEIDERYFEIACRRIDEAQRQPDLFHPPAAPPEQQVMAL